MVCTSCTVWHFFGRIVRSMNRDDTKESVYRYEKGFQGRTSRVYDRVPCERAKDGAYDPGGVFADAENGHALVCGA